MKQTSVTGYPRIGCNRELKKWTESYFKGELSKEDLLSDAADLRKKQWVTQKKAGVTYIPSNDFSLYDTFLDTAFLLNVIPERYKFLELDGLDTYFAMAKGYQGEKGDVHALPMKKWFNTNYHYIVPEIDDKTEIKLNGTKPFSEFMEARNEGIITKPVLIGPYTFLKLSVINCDHKKMQTMKSDIAGVYSEILRKFELIGCEMVQFDEPSLVKDMDGADIELFHSLYAEILISKGKLKVLLQTYFGDIRDCYESVMTLGFDAVGLDFDEGPENAGLIERYGFPENKMLFAGIVCGKNIWINNYGRSVEVVKRLQKTAGKAQIVISTSCSLLHVPYTVTGESLIPESYRAHFAFAQEKLSELKDIAALSDIDDYKKSPEYTANERIIRQKDDERFIHRDIREKAAGLSDSDFVRKPSFEERRKIQKKELGLPYLPSTTIGSFPQTPEVRKLRRKFKNGEIGRDKYIAGIKDRIAEVIKFQENIGLDVLVHGEFERNDMVEYFGEKLSGFVFTKNAWVQSYGTRCVKPPIIFGDVKRLGPMTVDVIKYAQSLTVKPVKGMLTGPVTILNWSFPREDLPRREIALQIALAIRGEAEDLEAAGIRIIQIDEAALREKLPLRRSDWNSKYLSWAIPAFRLVHSGVKPETQIHTHMCYSEFGDIIKDIDDMDADVITFEAAKSDLSIIDRLKTAGFKTEVGPGVYDIHSPRVPSVEEMESAILKMAERLDASKLWVNPDCGLKTRGEKETCESLKNMVLAAENAREKLKQV